MIEQLLQDLRRDEGWRPHVYLDSLGFQTIGHGFLVDARRGDGLPPEIGEAWLRLAAERHWSALLARLPWLAQQPDDAQRALGNMAYQLGVDGVLGFRLMLAALERGDRESAAENALASAWHSQTPARAERVAALLRGS